MMMLNMEDSEPWWQHIARHDMRQQLVTITFSLLTA